MSALCLLCGRGAPEIGYVDQHCFDRLDDTLRAIQTEAEQLSAVPSMAQASGTRGGTLASHRSPARLDALVLMDSRTAAGDDGTLGVLAVLGSWARLVRDERQLATAATIVRNRIGPLGPAHDDCPHDSCDRMRVTVLEPATVTGERRLLTAQLRWVVAQPWVDEFAAEVRAVLRQLQRANGTSPERRQPVGICPTLYDDGECGGKLWLNETRGAVACGSCTRTFDADELRHLGEMLIGEGYVEVFRAEWLTGVPASTIRRWTAAGRCASEKRGGRLMVRVSEVRAIRERTRPGASVSA